MKKTQKISRQIRVRAKIKGTSEKPRLSVFRSNAHIYAQIIDDKTAKTIIGISEKQIDLKDLKRIDLAKELGKLIAKKAMAKKITQVIFDRGSYKYHGRVKAVAEGAREGGLKL